MKSIFLILILLFSFIPFSLAQDTSNKSIPIITWISHDVNQTDANTLKDLGFTDVIVRYETNDSLCNASLSNAGLRMWRWVGPWWGYDFTVNGSTPEYPLMVDDTHAMLYDLEKDGRITQFLNGAERLGSDFVLVMFQDETLRFVNNYDFSKLHIDLYCLPNNLNETVIRECQSRCASVGIYLWVWNGFGVNWESITEQQISYAYQVAQACGVSRFTVWMGSEDNSIEKGMMQSSFLNFPQWFSVLKTKNNLLVNDMVVLPEFQGVVPLIGLLFSGIVILCSKAKNLKKQIGV